MQFIILVSFTSNITAQIVNIPDPILKYQLITFPIADLGNGFNEIADTNGDGQIQVSEAEAVLGLQLVEQSIADLEGLQYFINMEIIDLQLLVVLSSLSVVLFHYLIKTYYF